MNGKPLSPLYLTMCYRLKLSTCVEGELECKKRRLYIWSLLEYLCIDPLDLSKLVGGLYHLNEAGHYFVYNARLNAHCLKCMNDKKKRRAGKRESPVLRSTGVLPMFWRHIISIRNVGLPNCIIAHFRKVVGHFGRILRGPYCTLYKSNSSFVLHI